MRATLFARFSLFRRFLWLSFVLCLNVINSNNFFGLKVLTKCGVEWKGWLWNGKKSSEKCVFPIRRNFFCSQFTLEVSIFLGSASVTTQGYNLRSGRIFPLKCCFIVVWFIPNLSHCASVWLTLNLSSFKLVFLFFGHSLIKNPFLILMFSQIQHSKWHF